MSKPEPDPAIAALRRALTAVPDDQGLRLHLAQLLHTAARDDEAIAELSGMLAADPQHPGARELMAAALGADQDLGGRERENRSNDGGGQDGFNWSAAEDQVRDLAPMLQPEQAPGTDTDPAPGLPAEFVSGPGTPGDAFEVERPPVRLTDVGGMKAVKDRLTAGFLAPLQHPELRAKYGKSVRGGMLLYGPPGCGKTFLAKALAGELGASFLSAGLSEILDMWVGSSERNLHALFTQARRNAPCVLFLDEVDALGQKRSQTRHSAVRGSVNQLLTELDGIGADNEGVYVLAATNQPWDVDPALRRPGRLDRTVLVLPPDRPARAAIFGYHLARRPTQGIDLAALAAATDGLSGADIAYVCELATEQALLQGVRTGIAPDIGMAELRAAVDQVHPSTGPWLDTARTVVQYGEDDGTFAELKAYLKKTKRW